MNACNHDPMNWPEYWTCPRCGFHAPLPSESDLSEGQLADSFAGLRG